MSNESNNAKKLVVNLFNYIKEIKSRLEKQILDEAEYSWILNLDELPNHPNIIKNETESYFLKVKRPNPTACPSPPEELLQWLKPSWVNVNKDVEFLNSKNIQHEDQSVETIYIQNFPKIIDAIEDWKKIREVWRTAELPSEEVRKIFSYLHEAKAIIEKDGDGDQLYLTEGVLTQQSEKAFVRHPLIFKEVGIELVGDLQEPEILISKSNNESSIFINILRELEVNGTLLKSLKDEFRSLDLDPNDRKIDLFLKSLIHKLWQNGRFSDVKIDSNSEPILYLESKLLITKKENTFSEQIDNYISQINNITTLPVAFENMVGHFKNFNQLNRDLKPLLETSLVTHNPGKEYFLTKEYNPEQKKIIKLLDEHGCVSVQGPPGTGKSHTIANLVGHLLAKGESVLVSSYRSKALEVIREQVVDPIRSLCVSVLDDHKSNKDQLQKTVNFLEELISKNELGDITREVIDLSKKRNEINEQIAKLENDYLQCVLSEYRPIAFQGDPISPKNAAILISENISDIMFKGPFKSDFAPISEYQLRELKEIISNLTPNSQLLVKNGIPDFSNLINPEEFEFLSIEMKKNQKIKNNVKLEEFNFFVKHDSELLLELKNKVNTIFSNVEAYSEEYQKAIIDHLLKGESYVNTVEKFIDDCSASIEVIKRLSPSVFEFNPHLETEHDLDSLIKCAENIYNSSEPNIKFSFFSQLFSAEMKIIKEQAKVQNREIRRKEEVLSLVNYLKIKKERIFLKNKWDSLISSNFGAIKSSDFKKAIDDEISFRLIGIKSILELKYKIDDLKNVLRKINFVSLGKAYEEIKYKKNSVYLELESHLEEITQVVYEPLNAALNERKNEILYKKYNVSLSILEKHKTEFRLFANPYLCLQNLDAEIYKVQFRKIQELIHQEKLYKKLVDIAYEVSKIAPNVSKSLLNREIDSTILSISDIRKTWKVSYLDWVLTEKNLLDPIEIQDKLTDVKSNKKKLDSILIQKLSIKNQIERITPRQRQALRGFVIAQNKISKDGGGVRDAALRKEAKSQMKDCIGAVPVWIMPLSKVMDYFIIGEDVFDVLIIDEASQADITYLPLLTIAKKVIVVGDDKQVSPAAAGITLSGIDELINEFLEGIPNKAIYDYKASLYDIACSSFGETVRLSEHFRCTPEIIQFCNDLQYQGGIKALRESISNPTPPSIVPFYVEGVMDSSKKNYDEAKKIASIIAAMTETEKYANATIGVISLFGNVQHLLIDSFIRSIVSTSKYEKHKISCGKAPQFQGDERNIIFLSMVESPTSEGPLRLKSGTTDQAKKEYNVAVSRAKDQLWIMYSMDKDLHLKPDDIRLRLLKHAYDPRDLVLKYSQITSLAESPFEESVHKDLIRENYKFQPQYIVGAYRIDIVLFSSNKKFKHIALECDGEKYHHTEEQIKNDLERQSVLERLGFVFIRIRGSDYYRRREETIKKLFEKLDKLNAIKGIEESGHDIINLKVDNELLERSEKFRLLIEARIESGEVEEVSEKFFNKKWTKKNSPTTDLKAKNPPVFSKNNINFPDSGSTFKYSKIQELHKDKKCFSCAQDFIVYNNTLKSDMSYGYQTNNEIDWCCKICFKELKVKNNWKT